MATFAQINVRLGFLFDDKSLRAVERNLRSTGKRLSDIGGELTATISAPLAALGAAAISSAGDIESLTLALKSQLGGAQAAATELKLLTEAAKNPGLGVEQAVRGSVRLQGVKLSAEEARNVLVQMGNAIAATGGSAQELDAVTRQFAQMISKGRVLQEDVSVLSENMPGLAQLMQKAFGTTNVENIRNMGISGKEFVLQITKAAEELPRVEGGIKNSIGNAIDSLKQSAAKVGFALNKAFDITGAVESLSSGLLALAESFSSLEPSTQSLILKLAGIAIAIGPVLKAYGALKIFGSQLVTAWSAMVGGIKVLVGWMGTLRTAFLALNATMQAFLLVGIAAAVFAIADQMGAFTKELTAAERAQKAVNEVVKESNASVETERAKVGALVNVINDNTKSLAEKKSALDQLKKISPEYFGALDAEKGKVIDVTGAMNAYIDSLVRANVVKNATDEIGKLRVELDNVKEASDPTFIQNYGNRLLAFATGGIFAAKVTENLNNATKGFNEISLREGITQKITALEELVKKNLDLTTTTKETTKTITDNSAALSDAKGKAKLLNDVLADINATVQKARLFGENEDIAKVDALREAIEKLIENGFKPASAEIQRLKAEWDKLTIKPADINTALIPALPIPNSVSSQSSAPALPQAPGIQNGFGPDIKQQEQLAQAWKDVYVNAAQQIADSIGEIWSGLADRRDEREIKSINAEYAARIAAAEGNASLQSRLEADKQAKIDKIRRKAALRAKFIALGEAAINTAVAITKAIASAPPPLNIPAIVAAKIAGAAQLAVIAATPFAKGTNNAPGGLALVGEIGPELIELPRGSKVHTNQATNRMIGQMAGANNIMLSGEFRVQGTDLVLAYERTKAKNERYR